MTGLGADLIGIDAPPLSLAREWTAARAQRALASLADVARSIGAADTWARAALFGTDVGAGAAIGGEGMSLAWSPFPGIGFSREEDLRRLYPRSIEIVWGPERSLSPAPEKLRERLRSILTVHFEEFTTAMNVACAAREGRALPVIDQVDVDSDCVYSFEEAYRRRIVHALGFAASHETGSLAPYRDREEALLHGSFEDVVRVCGQLAGPAGLSVCANLLVRLSAVLACRQLAASPTRQPLARSVPEAPRKQAWLDARAHELAGAIRADFNEDGQAALGGLLCEIERARQYTCYGYGGYPPWGKIGTRDELGFVDASPP